MALYKNQFIIMIIIIIIIMVVVRALNLRLEIAGSIPATALSSATLDKSFTYVHLCHQAV